MTELKAGALRAHKGPFRNPAGSGYSDTPASSCACKRQTFKRHVRHAGKAGLPFENNIFRLQGP